MLAKLTENLNDLYVFYVVGKNKSFTSAAKTLFISQPAVTKRIKNLENRLGVKLIIRKSGHIELTEFGNLIYKKFSMIIEEFKKLEKEIKILKDLNLTKKINIGATPSYSKYLLSKILSNFIGFFPDLKIMLFSENSEHLLNLLLNNKLDLAIMTMPHKSYLKNFNIDFFRKEEIFLICSTNNPIANRTIKFNEIKQHQFIMREKTSGTRRYIENELKKRGISLNIKLESENSDAIKMILKNSNTLSFLAKTTVEEDIKSGELAQVFLPERLFVDIVIVTNKNVPDEIKKFIEILKEI